MVHGAWGMAVKKARMTISPLVSMGFTNPPAGFVSPLKNPPTADAIVSKAVVLPTLLPDEFLLGDEVPSTTGLIPF
jgi:hypothetical protein